MELCRPCSCRQILNLQIETNFLKVKPITVASGPVHVSAKFRMRCSPPEFETVVPPEMVVPMADVT